MRKEKEIDVDYSIKEYVVEILHTRQMEATRDSFAGDWQISILLLRYGGEVHLKSHFETFFFKSALINNICTIKLL